MKKRQAFKVNPISQADADAAKAVKEAFRQSYLSQETKGAEFLSGETALSIVNASAKDGAKAGDDVSDEDERIYLYPQIRRTFDPKDISDAKSTSVKHELMNTYKNVRTASMSLPDVVEMVSVALLDVHEESYGKKASEKLWFKVQDVSFDPDGCIWNATVKYSTVLVSKSITHKMVETEMQGKYPVTISCTSVLLQDDNDKNSGPFKIPDDTNQTHNSSEDSDDDDSQSSQSFFVNHHFSIELRMILEDDIKNIAKVQLKAMSETLSRISYDITRQIQKQTLPTFPEGCKDKTFRSVYQLNAKLKSGSFATVCIGTHRESNLGYAIKCVHRKKIPPQDDVAILSEVNILASLEHPRICPIIDFFIEDECYFIVMPLMEGGDVFDRIAKMKNYDEEIARNMVFEMLKALNYLHGNNIAHCDLKPKNLLLRKKDDDSSVILADFGFATRVYSKQSLQKQCGTPYFVAPEILLRSGYDTKADMWSIGVIIFSILSGSLPFTGKRHLDLFKGIVAGRYSFESEAWNDVSNDAKDLIRKLLVTNPAVRFSACDALNHPWIRAESRMLRRNALVTTSERLKHFNARLKFKTAILATHSMIKWRNLTRNSTRLREEVKENGELENEDESRAESGDL